MSGKDNSLTFLQTLFKRESRKSTSTSTKDKEKQSVILEESTRLSIKSISENISKMTFTLTNIYKKLMGNDIRNVNILDDKSKKDDKDQNKAKDEDKLSNKKKKEIDKSQKKVAEASKNKEGKGFGAVIKELSKVARSISKTYNKLATNAINLASKSLTSSSIRIDKEFRSMQLGMGLSNQGAMSLKGSMDKLGIEKSDLAYLTQGQRDALNDLNGMFNKLYDRVDMKAISKFGNDIYMMQAKASMVVEAFKTNVTNVLASLDPVINTVSGILENTFDVVNDMFGVVQTLFNSPVFQSLITTISEVINQLFNSLAPLLMSVVSMLQPLLEIVITVITPVLQFLGNIISVISQLLGFIMSLIGSLLQAILPIIEFVMTVLGNIFDFIITFLEPILSAVTQILGFIVSTVVELFTYLQPIFDLIGEVLSIFMNDTLDMLMSSLKLILSVIGPVLNFLKPFLKPIYDMIKVSYWILAMMFNALIAIRNAVVWWDKKDYLDPTMEDVNVDIETNTSMEISAKSGVAKTYAGSNNISSVSNASKITEINATYNQTVNGTASQYAGELARQNYESNQVLASLVESALGS